MNFIGTELAGVFIVEPVVFGDKRGWFMETYSVKEFADFGERVSFVQTNHSYTAHSGTLRGIHFQNKPMVQAKLVRVTRGEVLDVAVDLRKGSPNYRKWVGIKLSDENKRMLFIPRDFGHGYVTLTDDVEFQYSVDEFYSPEHDRSIRYNDPMIGIDWGITNPVLSSKDAAAPLLADSDCNFSWEGV